MPHLYYGPNCSSIDRLFHQHDKKWVALQLFHARIRTLGSGRRNVIPYHPAHPGAASWSQVILHPVYRGSIRGPSKRGAADNTPGACKGLGAVLRSAADGGLARLVAKLEALIFTEG